MADSMIKYVKFSRGSLKAYNAATKDKDTLYFIVDSDTDRSYLYLGDQLISGDINRFEGLEDIAIENAENGHLLAFDKEQKKWVNKSILQAIGLMAGATADTQGANGLVPAPGAGMQDAFLRGDGTWQKVSVSEGVVLVGDEKSVSLNDKTITLKDFGKKYYKFIPAEGSVEAHYEVQLVDATHPWSAGLEPKVVEENGKLVLGWFESNPTTLDGINSNITGLQNQVDNLNSEITVVKSSVSNIADLLNQKANIADVYTKAETQEKINEAVSNASHLKRKTFSTLVEAEQFATSISNADQYVYMILSSVSTGNNKYDEYLYVDGHLEKVGDWGVDLSDYATKAELENGLGLKVEKRPGYTLISEEALNKLSGIENNAEVNKIDSVDEIEFSLIGRHLSLNNVSISKINNLESILNSKATKEEVEEINETLTSKLNIVSNKVNSLESLLNSNNLVTKDYLEDELAPLKEAVMWQDL